MCSVGPAGSCPWSCRMPADGVGSHRSDTHRRQAALHPTIPLSPPDVPWLRPTPRTLWLVYGDLYDAGYPSPLYSRDRHLSIIRPGVGSSTPRWRAWHNIRVSSQLARVWWVRFVAHPSALEGTGGAKVETVVKRSLIIYRSDQHHASSLSEGRDCTCACYVLV